jgi:hypothetical protein
VTDIALPVEIKEESLKMRDSSSNKQQAWSVRGYKNGDEDGILQLIQLAFKWGDKKYWNWRYRDNPAGIGRIWLADDAGKIVSHYAMIPIRKESISSVCFPMNSPIRDL